MRVLGSMDKGVREIRAQIPCQCGAENVGALAQTHLAGASTTGTIFSSYWDVDGPWDHLTNLGIFFQTVGLCL